MIDQFTYPQGDTQTWDNSIGEVISTEIPDSLIELMSMTIDELHLTKWAPSFSQLSTERALMIGGAIPINEELLMPENRQLLKIRDRISGFTFSPVEPLNFDFMNFLPEDKELFRAMEARSRLNNNSSNPNISFDKIINSPIKEYEAKNSVDIEKILTEISPMISKNRGLKRLWLRGQRKEYKFNRNPNVVSKLPFREVANEFPSLVPSLGRFAIQNPGKVDFGYSFAGPNHWWKKPFLIWIIRQNPQWLSNNQEISQRFDNALSDESDDEFTKLLAETPFNPYIPDEIDDLRQWFFAHYKYSSWIWVLQQYGYLASMLDVTWDIDTALFFSQSQMIDKKYSLIEPSDERVIYVFPEWTKFNTFQDINSVDWGDSDWARQLPLRVERQRAGCLTGSTWFRQNFYGHLVIAKIKLHSSCTTSRKVEEVFPSSKEDLLLKTLLESKPSPEGLYY